MAERRAEGKTLVPATIEYEEEGQASGTEWKKASVADIEGMLSIGQCIILHNYHPAQLLIVHSRCGFMYTVIAHVADYFSRNILIVHIYLKCIVSELSMPVPPQPCDQAVPQDHRVRRNRRSTLPYRRISL